MIIIVMLNVAMKMISVMLWDDNVIEIISKKKMLSLRHIHVINLQIIVTLRNTGTAYFYMSLFGRFTSSDVNAWSKMNILNESILNE